MLDKQEARTVAGLLEELADRLGHDAPLGAEAERLAMTLRERLAGATGSGPVIPGNTVEARADAAAARDLAAEQRDLAARQRDEAADQRSLAALARSRQETRTPEAVQADEAAWWREQRQEQRDREAAARDRAAAAADRQAGQADREQNLIEREQQHPPWRSETNGSGTTSDTGRADVSARPAQMDMRDIRERTQDIMRRGELARQNAATARLQVDRIAQRLAELRSRLR
ncbi:hypothetical protein [Nonomuraea zeae]|uniref:Uncharacterized protein n=1 Tax=Nonomuraea zeae TaxID=1642303 RepID=A0A5S4G4B9_9ACTN|nr:hypothetical protein [Nonomuraea zeae]TMR27857.1 hypothetical protein ETD85_37750 [Nonomuraea zeae]